MAFFLYKKFTYHNPNSAEENINRLANAVILYYDKDGSLINHNEAVSTKGKSYKGQIDYAKGTFKITPKYTGFLRIFILIIKGKVVPTTTGATVQITMYMRARWWWVTVWGVLMFALTVHYTLMVIQGQNRGPAWAILGFPLIFFITSFTTLFYIGPSASDYWGVKHEKAMAEKFLKRIFGVKRVTKPVHN
ncbi:MAG: hypothetical protein FWE37_02375 [Spirochaetaceae bacterium]|nr:hypothetical protein [Spirochaetaceae bacterium]